MDEVTHSLFFFLSGVLITSCSLGINMEKFHPGNDHAGDFNEDEGFQIDIAGEDWHSNQDILDEDGEIAFYCEGGVKPGEKCDDGNKCTDNDICQEDGRCLGTTEVICNDGNDCTEDICQPENGCVFYPLPVWFKDEDGDGYGYDYNRKCSAFQPEGFVDKGGDCCDIREDVNPGQQNFFSEPFSCGSVITSFDYNCDGWEEKRWTSRGYCDNACNLHEGWMSNFVPECGRSDSFLSGCQLIIHCTEVMEYPHSQECR